MRMSDTEAIMWAVEKDPALRSDFINITVLDEMPDEQRLRAKVEAAIDRRSPARPAGCQPTAAHCPARSGDTIPRSISTTTSARSALPAPGGMRELLDFAASLRVDTARPLPPALGVHARRRARRRARRGHPEDAPHDHRRRRGLRLSLSLVDFERDPAPKRGPREAARQITEDAAKEQATPPLDPINRTSPLEVVADALGFALRATARHRPARPRLRRASCDTPA